MPLRPGRIGRVGVMGAPVAKAAVVTTCSDPRTVAGRKGSRRRCSGDAQSPPPHLTHPDTR